MQLDRDSRKTTPEEDQRQLEEEAAIWKRARMQHIEKRDKQIADLQRQLAEARADLRERETEIALMAARTGVHLRKIERLEQQLADAEADAQMMLELKRRSGERAQKVEALLYRGCNDCIYEPRNRNSDQCDGCDVWYGLLRAGIETERHGRTELNGRGQAETNV